MCPWGFRSVQKTSCQKFAKRCSRYYMHKSRRLRNMFPVRLVWFQLRNIIFWIEVGNLKQPMDSSLIPPFANFEDHMFTICGRPAWTYAADQLRACYWNHKTTIKQLRGWEVCNQLYISVIWCCELSCRCFRETDSCATWRAAKISGVSIRYRRSRSMTTFWILARLRSCEVPTEQATILSIRALWYSFNFEKIILKSRPAATTAFWFRASLVGSRCWLRDMGRADSLPS